MTLQRNIRALPGAAVWEPWYPSEETGGSEDPAAASTMTLSDAMTKHSSVLREADTVILQFRLVSGWASSFDKGLVRVVCTIPSTMPSSYTMNSVTW